MEDQAFKLVFGTNAQTICVSKTWLTAFLTASSGAQDVRPGTHTQSASEEVLLS